MKNITILLAFLALAFAALACAMPAAAPTPAAPSFDATKAVLEIQATQMSLQLTQAALQQPTTAPPPTDVPPTAAPAPTDVPPTTAPLPTEPQPTAAPDMSERIKKAKILVYEDIGNQMLAEWVKGTLDLMGLKYIHVGDAAGDFMSQLNSSTPWDLIIVAAESRSVVQGEFWDVITPKVTNDKTALIVEMWYLSNIANGRIQSLTAKCGIEYQSTRKFVEPIYLLDSANPVFSTPNGGFSLTNYNAHWYDKGGDYVRLTGSGDATLLAGGFLKEKSRYGLLTSCLEGRVIIQTFSSHDYNHDDMQMLWENYIVNTLTNHFNLLDK